MAVRTAEAGGVAEQRGGSPSVPVSTRKASHRHRFGTDWRVIKIRVSTGVSASESTGPRRCRIETD
ncbi:hypothetical protein HSR122_1938 [Halapricum desulfuricans]|uniref:Uncharacterized protein n=1 Tax=Halapricum desulfuricans TaxID=2841257 RepID=A0A897NE65_9EURY|nr:hypothetical protein HSR122_1938 [Halapricum desulfuricans]